MSHTQADLDRINRAIAGAELEVQYDGKRVKYRSLDELRAARALIQRDLDAQAKGRRPRFSVLRHGGKGL